MQTTIWTVVSRRKGSGPGSRRRASSPIQNVLPGHIIGTSMEATPTDSFAGSTIERPGWKHSMCTCASEEGFLEEDRGSFLEDPSAEVFMNLMNETIKWSWSFFVQQNFVFRSFGICHCQLPCPYIFRITYLDFRNARRTDERNRRSHPMLLPRSSGG